MKPVKVIHMDQVQGKTPPSGGGVWRRLVSNEETDSGLIFGHGVIQPGDGRGWHKHPQGEDEPFFVIQGEGLAEWKENGETFKKVIESGTAFYTPGDLENNITNIGKVPLRAVFAIVKAKA